MGFRNDLLTISGFQSRDEYQFTAYMDASGSKTAFHNIGPAATLSVPVSETYQLQVGVDCWLNSSTTDCVIWFQVLIDGNALAMPWNASQYFNHASQYLAHTKWSWEQSVTLSGGSHTFQLQWKQTNATTTVAVDGNSGRNFTITT